MAEYTQAQLESMVSQIQADGLESLRSSDVCALLFGYGDLLAKRDTLAAELVALRAGLPRWQRHGELWLLIAGTHRVWVEPVGDKWRPMHFGPETYSLEDAMVVAGGYLGLPPCVVEGE